MTDKQHPITPPPELVEQWYEAIDNSSTSWKQELAIQAARWGADQQLEACCEWVANACPFGTGKSLRAAMRPTPLSMAEEALEQAESFACSMQTLGMDSDLILAALKRLKELESK